MPTTAAIFDFDLPAAPTILFVVAVVVIVLYRLITDNGMRQAQQVEIESLRSSIKSQSERHQRDLMIMEERHQRDAVEFHTKLDTITALYDEQRSQKHETKNQLARVRLALDIVWRLQQECTCGALSPLEGILSNMAAHNEI